MSAALLVGCGPAQSEGDPLTVSTVNGQKVRLEVVSPKIVRVQAVPDTVPMQRDESLIIVKQQPFADYTTEQTDAALTVKTSELTVTLDKATGVVSFADQNGAPILAEDPQGRSFEHYGVDDTKGHTDGLSFQQKWIAGPEDAIYGLGQHQADEFNYRGKNEELFQYNTKVSIPFFVSNKGYGILWDNYSLTRYGDKRDYAQLNEAFKVTDKDGNPGGLSSHWVADPATGVKPLDRVEPYLYFENLKANRELLPDFPLQGAQVTFDGYLEPSETGTYRFYIYYAGYTRIFIDGKELFPEIWRTAWNPNGRKFQLEMSAGKKVKLHIDWKPDGGESYCSLRCLTPVPDEEQNKLAFWSQMGDELDYYFIKGSDMDNVISGYRQLTGKSQVMAKWVMGYWQSREKYNTQEELLSTLTEFRKRNIPIDNIVMDWLYWKQDQWGSFEFDPERFPDPKAMIDSVHALKAHIMISHWPKYYANTEHFKELDAQGWMYRQAIQDSIRDWVGPGYIGSFYDAYAPGARKLFWQQMYEHLYKIGIDAWWMDASEPNVRDCTDIEYRKKLCGPTYLGPSDKYFNTYSLVNAMAIYDGQRSVDDTSRVFLLTRSGFAGLQRYSTATWSGDIATRWEDMKAQISAGLNFAVAGVPYWSMDIGGFCVEHRYEKAQQEFEKTGKENADLKEWKELQTRWYQWGTFVPLFRSHGQWPTREVFNLAKENEPTYKSIVDYIKLRYTLMPYIYSLAGMTNYADYTIMRPLVMDYTADTRVNGIGDQFLCGPSLMVCPVYTYQARSRKVYMPENQGGWYDFYTGKSQAGGAEIEADAPYEKVPVFVPAGAIIPTGPDIQYANQVQPDTLNVYVYAGRDGKFTLYEDEGTNYNYEQGQRTLIELTYNDAAKSLSIGARDGQFKGMREKRTFNVVLVKADSPVAFGDVSSAKSVEYSGQPVEVQL